MRIRPFLAVAAALIPLAAVAAPAVEGAPLGRPGIPTPFFGQNPGGGDPEGFPGLTAPSAPARPPAGSRRTPDAEAADAPPPKPATRAERLGRLLDRLAAAHDGDEARGIAGRVERLWMESGSDTADLLMERAVAAMNGDRHDVAAALLDTLVELRPGWAEAWNKRATLRFLDGDDVGAMEDISHVLALEPRHFGALSGMGSILERHGEDAAALTALRRALAVYPEDAEIRKAVDELAPAVDGQAL